MIKQDPTKQEIRSKANIYAKRLREEGLSDEEIVAKVQIYVDSFKKKDESDPTQPQEEVPSTDFPSEGFSSASTEPPEDGSSALPIEASEFKDDPGTDPGITFNLNDPELNLVEFTPEDQEEMIFLAEDIEKERKYRDEHTRWQERKNRRLTTPMGPNVSPFEAPGDEEPEAPVYSYPDIEFSDKKKRFAELKQVQLEDQAEELMRESGQHGEFTRMYTGLKELQAKDRNDELDFWSRVAIPTWYPHIKITTAQKREGQIYAERKAMVEEYDAKLKAIESYVNDKREVDYPEKTKQAENMINSLNKKLYYKDISEKEYINLFETIQLEYGKYVDDLNQELENMNKLAQSLNNFKILAGTENQAASEAFLKSAWNEYAALPRRIASLGFGAGMTGVGLFAEGGNVDKKTESLMNFYRSASEITDELSFPIDPTRTISSGLGQAMGQISQQLGVATITGGAGATFVLSGAMVYDEALHDFLTNSDLTPMEAHKWATLYALVATPMEFVGNRVGLNNVATKRLRAKAKDLIMKGVTPEVFEKELRSAARKVGTDMYTEAIEEGLTEVSQTGYLEWLKIKKNDIDRNRAILEGKGYEFQPRIPTMESEELVTALIEAFAFGAAAGGFGGGAVSAYSASRYLMADEVREVLSKDYSYMSLREEVKRRGKAGEMSQDDVNRTLKNMQDARTIVLKTQGISDKEDRHLATKLSLEIHNIEQQPESEGKKASLRELNKKLNNISKGLVSDAEIIRDSVEKLRYKKTDSDEDMPAFRAALDYIEEGNPVVPQPKYDEEGNQIEVDDTGATLVNAAIKELQNRVKREKAKEEKNTEFISDINKIISDLKNNNGSMFLPLAGDIKISKKRLYEKQLDRLVSKYRSFDNIDANMTEAQITELESDLEQAGLSKEMFFHQRKNITPSDVITKIKDSDTQSLAGLSEENRNFVRTQSIAKNTGMETKVVNKLVRASNKYGYKGDSFATIASRAVGAISSVTGESKEKVANRLIKKMEDNPGKKFIPTGKTRGMLTPLKNIAEMYEDILTPEQQEAYIKHYNKEYGKKSRTWSKAVAADFRLSFAKYALSGKQVEGTEGSVVDKAMSDIRSQVMDAFGKSKSDLKGSMPKNIRRIHQNILGDFTGAQREAKAAEAKQIAKAEKRFKELQDEIKKIREDRGRPLKDRLAGVFGLGQAEEEYVADKLDKVIGQIAFREGTSKTDILNSIDFIKGDMELYQTLNESEYDLFFQGAETLTDLKGIGIWTSPVIEGMNKLKKLQKSPPEVWIKKIQEAGGSGTKLELEWLGLEELMNAYLEDRPGKKRSMSWEEVSAIVDANKIELREVLKEGQKGAHAKWTSDNLADDQIMELMGSRGEAFDRRYADQGDIKKMADYTDYKELLLVRPQSAIRPYLKLRAEQLENELAELGVTPVLMAGSENIKDEHGSGIRYDLYEFETAMEAQTYLQLRRKADKLKKSYDKYADSPKTDEEGQQYYDDDDPIVQSAKEYTETKRMLNEAGKVRYNKLSIRKESFPFSNFTDEQIDMMIELISILDSYSDAARFPAHFSDNNVLGFARTKNRNYGEEKVLHIEELQSDWIQVGNRESSQSTGRKVGFRDPGFIESKAKIAKLNREQIQLRFQLESAKADIQLRRLDGESMEDIRKDIGEALEKVVDKAEEIKELIKEQSTKYGTGSDVLPDVAWNKTETVYPLVIKRMLKYAADNGYDRISFASGIELRQRYYREELFQIPNLSIRLNEKLTKSRGVNVYDFTKVNLTGEEGMTRDKIVDVNENDLKNWLSDEDYAKVKADMIDGDKDFATFTDISIGGYGLQRFYDEMLPRMFNNVVKKLDKNSKQERIDLLNYAFKDEMEIFHKNNKVPVKNISYNITGDLKSNLENANGQIPLFQGGTGSINVPRAAYLKKGGKHVIYSFVDPDITSPLHEIAHVFENFLSNSEKDTVLKWAGKESWDRDVSEKFAEGFEKYSQTTPSKLKKIFNKFAVWFARLFEIISFGSVNVVPSAKVTRIYDKMMTDDSKANVWKTSGIHRYVFAEDKNRISRLKASKIQERDVTESNLKLAEELLSMDPATIHEMFGNKGLTQIINSVDNYVKNGDSTQLENKNEDAPSMLPIDSEKKKKPQMQVVAEMIANVKMANRELSELAMKYSDTEMNESLLFEIARSLERGAMNLGGDMMGNLRLYLSHIKADEQRTVLEALGVFDYINAANKGSLSTLLANDMKMEISDWLGERGRIKVNTENEIFRGKTTLLAHLLSPDTVAAEDMDKWVNTVIGSINTSNKSLKKKKKSEKGKKFRIKIEGAIAGSMEVRNFLINYVNNLKNSGRSLNNPVEWNRLVETIATKNEFAESFELLNLTAQMHSINGKQVLDYKKRVGDKDISDSGIYNSTTIESIRNDKNDNNRGLDEEIDYYEKFVDNTSSLKDRTGKGLKKGQYFPTWNFVLNQERAADNNARTVHVAPAVRRLHYAINSPILRELVRDDKAVESMRKVLKRVVNYEYATKDVRLFENAPRAKSVFNTIIRFKNQVLWGLTQPLKQLSTIAGTVVMHPYESLALLTDLMSREKADAMMELMVNNGSVLDRNANYLIESASSRQLRIDRGLGIQDKIERAAGVMGDIAIAKPDAAAAIFSWLTAYRAKVKGRVDWGKEVENPSPMAASYAETTQQQLMGANIKEAGPQFAVNKTWLGGWFRYLRDAFFAFKFFPASYASGMWADAATIRRQVMRDPADIDWEAGRRLLGMAAVPVAFGAVSKIAAKHVNDLWIETLKLFYDDDEEEELDVKMLIDSAEEYSKSIDGDAVNEEIVRQFVNDFMFAVVPSVISEQLINETINRAQYELRSTEVFGEEYDYNDIYKTFDDFYKTDYPAIKTFTNRNVAENTYELIVPIGAGLERWWAAKEMAEKGYYEDKKGNKVYLSPKEKEIAKTIALHDGLSTILFMRGYRALAKRSHKDMEKLFGGYYFDSKVDKGIFSEEDLSMYDEWVTQEILMGRMMDHTKVDRDMMELKSDQRRLYGEATGEIAKMQKELDKLAKELRKNKIDVLTLESIERYETLMRVLSKNKTKDQND